MYSLTGSKVVLHESLHRIVAGTSAGITLQTDKPSKITPRSYKLHIDGMRSGSSAIKEPGYGNPGIATHYAGLLYPGSAVVCFGPLMARSIRFCSIIQPVYCAPCCWRWDGCHFVIIKNSKFVAPGAFIRAASRRSLEYHRFFARTTRIGDYALNRLCSVIIHRIPP